MRLWWLPESFWMILDVSCLTSWCMCGSRYALLIFAEHFLESQTSFSPSSWVKPGKPLAYKVILRGVEYPNSSKTYCKTYWWSYSNHSEKRREDKRLLGWLFHPELEVPATSFVFRHWGQARAFRAKHVVVLAKENRQSGWTRSSTKSAKLPGQERSTWQRCHLLLCTMSNKEPSRFGKKKARHESCAIVSAKYEFNISKQHARQ